MILIQGPFWLPLSPANGRDGPTGVPNSSTQCIWMVRIHITCLGPLTDLYGTPKGPILAPKGPQRDLGGPEGPDLVPTAANGSDWAGIMVTRHFDLVSGLFWAPRAPKRARFGPKWGQNSKFLQTYRVTYQNLREKVT